MDMAIRDVTIRPFAPADQAPAQQLILAGLGEHWGAIDFSLNQDLNDIGHTYANGTFLVATFDDKIIGTGALLPAMEGTGQIVRMSVHREWRRQGIGRRLLDALIQAARQRGYRRLLLETTSSWQEVVQFYRRYGFSITHYDLTAGETHMVLMLAPEATGSHE
jgi:putative acetyltransferase